MVFPEASPVLRIFILRSRKSEVRDDTLLDPEFVAALQLFRIVLGPSPTLQFLLRAYFLSSFANAKMDSTLPTKARLCSEALSDGLNHFLKQLHVELWPRRSVVMLRTGQSDKLIPSTGLSSNSIKLR